MRSRLHRLSLRQGSPSFVLVALILCLASPAWAGAAFNARDMDYWGPMRLMLVLSELVFPDLRLELPVTPEQEAALVLSFPLAMNLGALPLDGDRLRPQGSARFEQTRALLGFGAKLEPQVALPSQRGAQWRLLGLLEAQLSVRIDDSHSSLRPFVGLQGGGVWGEDGSGAVAGASLGVFLPHLAPVELFPHAVSVTVRRVFSGSSSRWDVGFVELSIGLPGAEWF